MSAPPGCYAPSGRVISLYFTHPENRSAVERRFAAMRAGFDDADSFTGS